MAELLNKKIGVEDHGSTTTAAPRGSVQGAQHLAHSTWASRRARQEVTTLVTTISSNSPSSLMTSAELQQSGWAELQPDICKSMNEDIEGQRTPWLSSRFFHLSASSMVNVFIWPVWSPLDFKPLHFNGTKYKLYLANWAKITSAKHKSNIKQWKLWGYIGDNCIRRTKLLRLAGNVSV